MFPQYCKDSHEYDCDDDESGDGEGESNSCGDSHDEVRSDDDISM